MHHTFPINSHPSFIYITYIRYVCVFMLSLSFEGFMLLYTEAAAKDIEKVWRDLRVQGYGYNLEKIRNEKDELVTIIHL